MPTLEFHGYSLADAQQMTAQVREALVGLPFCEDIVFVERGPSRVVAWNGEEQPFVRILTRSKQRAGEIQARLTHMCDLEVVIINFIRRRRE